MKGHRKMSLLDQMRKEVNRAYLKALHCQDSNMKARLYSLYQRENEKYQKQKDWIKALES